MSPFKFPCHNCGQRLAVFEEQIGTTEPCPSCGAMVTVTAPSPPAIPPPEEAVARTPIEEKAEAKRPQIKISCQSCGQRLSVFEDQIGTTEPCPSCEAMVTVVAPSPPPMPPPEEAVAKAPVEEKAEARRPQIKISCQSCGQRLSVFEDQIGTTEPCPSCEAMVTVVAPSPPPMPPPEEAVAKAPVEEKVESKKPESKPPETKVPETKPPEATSQAAPLAAASLEAGKDPITADAVRPAPSVTSARKEERAPSRQPPGETKRSERAASSASPPPPAPRDRFHRLMQRIRVSRYLTISFLLHAFAGMTLGGVVLYHVAPKDPDFVAGSAGLLVEETAPPLPPEASPPGEAMQYQSTPQAPLMSVPVSVITTVQVTPTAAKIAPVAPRGLSDSMKGALSALDSRRSSPGVSSGGSGTVGGSRWATIFGKRIVAARLGVILDFSASAYPHLPGAVEEIQRGFSDAILILYPGCGMVQFEGNSDHEIRKFSSITPQEIEATRKNFDTTGAQIWSAMKISELAQMATRPTVKDTLFVSWYAPKPASWTKLIGRTQVVFDDLMKRKVDAIYWFSDFADPVDPRVVDQLAVELKNRRIKLHLHNFGDTEINPDIKALAEKSGGTVSGRNGNN